MALSSHRAGAVFGKGWAREWWNCRVEGKREGASGHEVSIVPAGGTRSAPGQ